MPTHCCIPNCRSNYDSTVIAHGVKSIFRFPKDSDLKQKWIHAIPRKGFTPTKTSVVCELHFNSDEVIKFDKYLLPNGTLKMIPCKPKLKRGAVPSLFRNFPKYLFKQKSIHKDPECKLEIQILQHETLIEDFKKTDIIENYEYFLKHFTEKLNISENWNEKIVTSKVIFYTLNFSGEVLKIENQISINNDLTVKIFVNGNELYCFNELKWISDIDMKINRWSQMQNLLDRFKHTYYPTRYL